MIAATFQSRYGKPGRFFYLRLLPVGVYPVKMQGFAVCGREVGFVAILVRGKPDFEVFVFLILFFTDLESRILPDELTLGGVLLAFGCSFFLDDPNWKGSLFGATLGFLILWGAYLFHLKWKKKEGLGWGDIKLILLIGALFGPFRMLWILITASLIGLIVGLGVIVLFKRGRDYELPFGSFLALASILFLFRFSWLEHFFSKWTNLAP